MGCHPVLLVVSAPSGAGKTTLCNRLRAWAGDTLRYSISWTTRPPRPGERNGEHYRFVDKETFDRNRKANGFLEYARVHGHWYGTPRSAVEESVRSGVDIIMDIDVQGAAQIRETVDSDREGDVLKSAFADVFVRPPSLAELRRRLETRGQDAPEVIEQRIQKAASEMERAGEYRYGIVNDRLETAFDVLRSILVAERHRYRGRGSGKS